MSDEPQPHRTTGPRLNFGALVMLCTFLLGQTVAVAWWAGRIDNQVERNSSLASSMRGLEKTVMDIRERTVRLESLQEAANREMRRLQRPLGIPFKSLEKHDEAG